MKNFLSQNWFKIIILIIIVFIAYIFYQSKIVGPREKQMTLENCVAQAQEKKYRLDKSVTEAWIEGRVDSDYQNRSHEEIQKIYEEQRSECYRLYD